MLQEVLEWFNAIATGAVDALGHWGIFLVMMAESANVPLPSEPIMLYGGYMAQEGVLNFWLVIAAAVLGNLLGSIAMYWLGKYGGRKFLQKYGKYFFIKEKEILRADIWFANYGEWTVFFGRLLPLVRTLISLPAGIARMNFMKFVIFTLLGSIPWTFALVWAGYQLGQNWGVVEPYLKPFSYAVVGLIGLLILWFLFKRLRGRFAPR